MLTPRIRTIDDVAKAEFYRIRKQIAINRTLGSSWVVMWKKPSYQKRAVLNVAITGIIQCSGVLVINSYSPCLYQQLGFSTTKQLLYPAAWLTSVIGLPCYIGWQYMSSA
jgi:hypothetical protein